MDMVEVGEGILQKVGSLNLIQPEGKLEKIISSIVYDSPLVCRIFLVDYIFRSRSAPNKDSSLREDIISLRDDIEVIQANLLDARFSSDWVNGVWRHWIADCRLCFYKTDDFVEDVSTTALKARQRRSLLSHFFLYSPSNIVKWKQEVKYIRDNLERRRTDMLLHGLLGQSSADPVPEVRIVRKRAETNTFLFANEIIGRDEYEKKILLRLISSGADNSGGGGVRVTVVALVGMVGIGKTALVRLVYNHCDVVNHFDLRVWVFLGHDLDLYETLGSIVEAISGERVKGLLNLEELENRIRETMPTKSLLLVLDDVWTGDRDTWLQLTDLLSAVAPKSKIILTTRSEGVAAAVGTDNPIELGPLSDNKALELFKRIAFDPRQDINDPHPEELCRKIVRIACNVPLFIRTLGAALYGQPKEKWLEVAGMELSQHPQPYDQFVPILKLTYDNLPFHLKRCFAYCALLPKHYELDKNMLVHLWIAQGFIKQPLDDPCQTLEDAADECFVDLMSWSLFKDVTRDGQGNIRSFKMDDSAYDLAQSVARTESFVGDPSSGIADQTFFHKSLDGSSDSLTESSIRLFPDHLRSIFKRPGSTMHLTASCCNKIFRCLKRLRVLDLHETGLTVVPETIRLLKHLRYVNLSNNPFTRLPHSITELINLQVLDVSHCKELQQLPKRLRRLGNLRHLYLGGCEKLTGMPVGLDQLTSLQTLSHFVLGKSRRSCKLDELGALNLKAEVIVVIPNTQQ